MNVQRFPLGQMQANCYFLTEDDELIIVDPADDATFILEEIQRRNLKLLALLATHGHFDHIMAAGEIQKSFDVPLYIKKEDGFLLQRTGSTAKHFLGYDPVVLEPSTIIYTKKGQQVIGSFRFEVFETPGHTPGAVCYYFPRENTIFTGDTLFKEGIGRYDFSYSNKIDLFASLDRLFALPGETEVYPGHGEDTFIETEKKVMSENSQFS